LPAQSKITPVLGSHGALPLQELKAWTKVSVHRWLCSFGGDNLNTVPKAFPGPPLIVVP
jgi:hypothetical protein